MVTFAKNAERMGQLAFIKMFLLMGQLAFIKMFLLVSIPTDVNDNRRHIHIFRKGGRHLHSEK